jgi:hypothetical protein
MLLRIALNGATMQFRSALRNRTLWVAVTAAVVYWLAGSLLPTQPFLETVRIAQGTFSTVALVALSRATWAALVNPEPDRADALTLTVALKELSGLVMGIWLLLFRLSASPVPCTPECGRAVWMLDTLWFGFVTGWLPALSSLLLVTVPGVLRRDEETGENVPPGLLVAVGCVVGLGLFAVLVVLATKPDARWLVEALRPWMR